MILETIEAKGLAHLSYLIGDDAKGVCAVIDPRRDTGIYLDLARKHNARITHIFETHIHADFVSGSLELAAQTGALLCVGASTEYNFLHQALKEGDTVALGSLSLRVFHTPGHTPEHVCFLVSGGKGSNEPWALFSGDTLFSGEVGRPDLLGGGSEEKLACALYHTLHDTLLKLGDEVEVYPAHGQGSPCGGSIGDRNTTTIGYERLHNPKLQNMDEAEFVTCVLSELPPAPYYYPRMKKVNAKGPAVLHCLPHIPPLDSETFQREIKKPGTMVVDTREIEAFGGAHIKGAINIALRDEFPQWAGWMLKPEDRLFLVLTDEGDLDLVERHLLRVDLENIAGFLRHGMRGWLEAGLPFERTSQMSVQELHQKLKAGQKDLQVLDVRRDDEWNAGFIPTAKHVFAPYLPEQLKIVKKSKPVVVYCGSGYRASVAASVLQQQGFADVSNVPGGMAAWKAAGYSTEKP
jgi:hydroxyacylglutathione hydrolase